MWLIAATVLASCNSTPQQTPSIIPEPLSVRMSDGNLELDGDVYISINDPSLEPAAGYVTSLLSKFGIKASTKGGGTPLNLRLTTSHRSVGSYTVEVTSKAITVAAPSYDGIINGIATVAQMLPTDGSHTLPVTVITDSPRMQWRGMMLDVSRHFFTVEEVKEFLDLMALYKLNKFHWHLTDDQGWRIEIKKYPLLTERGAWRKFNDQDRGCMNLARTQDNPAFEIPQSKLRINGKDTLYGGYYTQEQIKDVVAYAAARSIDIIPEIDMPGHILAAIENYRGISCFNRVGWGQTFSSPLCPGKESALEFARGVYEEVFELFPYEYVHLGADEVEKDNWKKCPDCRERMRVNNLTDEHKLQAWFVQQMEEYFNANGKRLIGWDEIIEGGLSDNATVTWWRSWAGNAVKEATAHGNNVIICPNEVFYFDYQQDENTLRKLYEYEPIDTTLTMRQKELVMGVQANVWAEWIPSRERFYYMITPRIMALSELCWVEPSVKEWDHFLGKVKHQIGLLEHLKLTYRPLDIMAIPDYKEGGNQKPQKRQASYAYTSPVDILFTNPTPGATIRYTTDGTMPNSSSTLVEGPVTVDRTTDFTLRTFTADGRACEAVTTRIVIEPCSPADSTARPTGLGLKAVWHNYPGNRCSGIESTAVKGTFKVSKVEIPEGVKGNIGLVFTGYIDVPQDDVYTFALTSDDGSQLWIDGRLTIDNDGPHGPRTVTGQKALAKGLHPVKIYYFDNNGGTLSMSMIRDGKEVVVEGDFFKL